MNSTAQNLYICLHSMPQRPAAKRRHAAAANTNKSPDGSLAEDEGGLIFGCARIMGMWSLGGAGDHNGGGRSGGGVGGGGAVGGGAHGGGGGGG